MPGPVERTFEAFPVAGVNRTLQAPFEFFTDGADNLRLNVWSWSGNCTIAVTGRMRTPDRNVQVFTQALKIGAGAGAKQSKLILLGAGNLLNCAIRVAAGAIDLGDTYVQLELVRGFSGDVQPFGTILQGYVGTESSLAWPGSPHENPVSGVGLLRTFEQAAPSPGGDFAIEVPTGVRWEVVAVTATLSPDATVATRRAALLLAPDGIITVGEIPTSLVQGASTSVRHTWLLGGSRMTEPGTGAAVGALPSGLQMLAGGLIASMVANKQAGDTWSLIAACVRQWIDP